MEDLGAVLITRAWPRAEVLVEFDEWQTSKHLIDLTGLSGVQGASYYASRAEGLPQAWKGTGNRMAAYWGVDIAALTAWMTDPGLAAAIEDGSRFFGSFNELDDSSYTGNLYEFGPSWPGDPAPSLDGCLLVERFEVPEALVRGFDDWVVRKHLPRLRSTHGVRWAQWGKAVRGLPVEYYNSPGSRVVLAELATSDVRGASIDDLVTIAGDSQQWDLRLEYTRREVFEALAAFGGHDVTERKVERDDV